MKKYFLVIIALTFVFNNILKADLFENSLRIVGESEKDTQQAKAEAINTGREKSLLFVISKITSKSSLEKIQGLLVETKPFSFEKRFSLQRETITNKKYSADANFVFDENKIRNFLDANGIPYTSVSLGRYIIIPAYYENGKLVEEGNIWSNYWSQITSDSSLEFLSTFIYYGNMDIIKDKIKLLDIKENLNVDDIYLLNLYAENNGTYTLEVKSGLTDKLKKVTNIPSIQNATMLAPAEIEEEKKKEVLNSYTSNSSEQKIRISAKNYEDWVFIEQKLKETSAVSSFVLKTIGIDYIIVDVKLKANVDKFKKSMEAKCVLFDIPNLELSKIPDCL